MESDIQKSAWAVCVTDLNKNKREVQKKIVSLYGENNQEQEEGTEWEAPLILRRLCHMQASINILHVIVAKLPMSVISVEIQMEENTERIETFHGMPVRDRELQAAIRTKKACIGLPEPKTISQNVATIQWFDSTYSCSNLRSIVIWKTNLTATGAEAQSEATIANESLCQWNRAIFSQI